MRHKGTIAVWNDDKGFGFIEPARSRKRLFVHISGFEKNVPRPREGDSISFEVSKDFEGRPRASRARITGASAIRWKYFASSIISMAVSVIFLLAVYYAVEVRMIPSSVLGVYLILGVITFFAYALDKSAARKDRWRTQETTLHTLSVLGGWPGGLVARQLMRHKTRKQPFRTLFWITVILNGGMLIWMLTSDGQVFVRNYLVPFLTWLQHDFLRTFEPFWIWLKYEFLR